ncbi:DeoR/GlpR transcriptional regulator [Cryobacterium sp. TMT2-18-3]|uniref:DeoR/GlpR family DNA-binding transcription regulator n=1 Tax=unclassified Cryobacterium TaxID=2649013 RepID=UPI0010692669|nr:MULTISPECIES: DeoR/GlpR family DNA-binding transcription regulator [unclassified Cryobacterium]TFC26346.1 DeoR/GlpR transcriptional regulator [Cryobacterium sp. TMT2-18-2]TFC60512.1 DeoR/GlpR transcriptional regulator [Cryobacterium sp. TMT2-15-1]TFC64474.1 DeoR/GlpR transcriptional regulator [Cryobacterium sp. TMT2-18-3]
MASRESTESTQSAATTDLIGVSDGPGDRDTLPAHQRREQIQRLVGERGFVRVRELREAFGVSGVTARADLDVLESAGTVQRVHGGAVPAAPPSGRPLREFSFEEALASSVLPKQQIGVLAAALVTSGQSILLDVGTTTLSLAHALLARTDLTDVVIITNGLSIALALEPAIPRFTVIVTGGSLRPLQHSLVEPLARTVLSQVHADLAFIGCNGVDAGYGVTNINLPEAGVKTLMLAAATRAVVVADASKLGQVHLGQVGPLRAFDTLVTDAAADEVRLAPLREAGLTVLQPE